MQSFVKFLEKVHPQEDRLKFIEEVANSTPDIIYVLDLEEKRIIFINDRVSVILGYEPEEIYSLGRRIFSEKMHPDDYLRRMEHLDACADMTENEIRTMDVRLRVMDGSWQWFRMRDIPFKFSGDKVTQIIGVARNVHELKLCEDENERKEALLDTDNLSKTILHEIRNPLTNIHLSVQMMKKGLTEDPAATDSLFTLADLIERNALRIEQLLRDIISPSNQPNAAFVNCQFSEIIEEALEMANDRLLLKNIIVEKFLQYDCEINADCEKIKLVILNILINSIEAIGDKRGKISISLYKNAKQIGLTIADNGCGMTDHQLSLVFKPYYSTKADGIGIGLLTVKSILEKHDATFHISSKVGKGTVFTIFFNCLPNKQ